MLVFSLTISNFLFSIFLFPFMIVSTIKQIWSFGEVWCSLSGFLSLTTLAASMFTLLLISCDRFVDDFCFVKIVYKWDFFVSMFLFSDMLHLVCFMG